MMDGAQRQLLIFSVFFCCSNQVQFGRNSNVKGTLEAMGSKGRKLTFGNKASYALQKTATRPFKYLFDRQDLIKQNSPAALRGGQIHVQPAVANNVQQPIARNPSRSILVRIKTG